MKSKLLRTLLTGWLIGISSACSHVTIHDKEVCGNLGEYGAHCAHTLIDKTRDMTKAQWEKQSVGWLCTNSTGFNDGETALEELCTQSNLCDYATRQELRAAFDRIRNVAHRAQFAQEQAAILGE